MSNLRKDVPAELMAQLDGADRENRLRNLELVGELVSVIDHLAAAGIDALPYKGPMVALGAYGDLGLREFVDLDFLVRPQDAIAALNSVGGLGYAPWIGVTDRQLRYLVRTGHDRKLIRDERFVVEIQWALAERSCLIPRDPSPLFSRTRSVAIAGRDVPTLSTHDELLILAIHGSLHLWERLGWVCDLLEVARGEAGPRVVDDVLIGAERLGVRRHFLVGFAVAQDALGLSAPPSVSKAISQDAALERVDNRPATSLDRRDL